MLVKITKLITVPAKQRMQVVYFIFTGWRTSALFSLGFVQCEIIEFPFTALAVPQ